MKGAAHCGNWGNGPRFETKRSHTVGPPKNSEFLLLIKMSDWKDFLILAVGVFYGRFHTLS